MRIKPFKNFKSIVYLIFFFGLIVDTYSVYTYWLNLNNDEQINQILASNGIESAELGLDSMIESYQSGMSLMLLIFLLWDYVAYYYFLKHKEWARKYIISIALFYLISCLWEISILQGLYGVLTLYYLWGAREEFLPKEKTKHG